MFRRQLLLSICFGVFLLFFGCSSQKDPVSVVDQYTSLWEAKNYEDMYAVISPEDQGKLPLEDFKKIYEELYTDLNVDSITVENLGDKQKIKEEIEKEEEVNIPIKVTLVTEYDEKSYNTDVNVIKEEVEGKSSWHIDWDYNLVYENLEEGDSIITRTTLPVRGVISDRNGNKLAENGTVIQVGIVPGRLGDMKEEMIGDIAKAFSISEEYIEERLNLSWVQDDSFVDIVKIPVDQLSKIEEIYAKNNGATYKEVVDRVYPYKEIAAHLTGYLGYIEEEELKALEGQGFTSNSKLGKTGLEKIFDKSLRGVPGKKVALVSNNGTEKEVLKEEKAKDGENLALTIDIEFQKKLYESMKGEMGTASSVNYKNGEVLAIVSSPSYDPNKFILGISSEELAHLQEDEKNPLLNRFTKVYTPGSVFKPITAAIALTDKIIDESFTINVRGKDWQKDESWGDYFITRVTDPGTPVDLEKAMVYSDNIYFGQVALKIGEENFIEKAKDYGIGVDINVRYSMNRSQLANENKLVNEILLADTGYGQGQVLVNILNIPKAYSAFVNDGSVVEPKLIVDEAEPVKTNIISKEVAAKIFNLMVKVVEDPNGTGREVYIEGKTIAGKTGTAEVSNANESNQKDQIGWFSAIDRSEDTPYITTMMIEDVQGRGGSHVVIPLVRSFIETY